MRSMHAAKSRWYQLRGEHALLPLSAPQPPLTAPCCADASLPEDGVLLPHSLPVLLLGMKRAAALLWLSCLHLPQQLGGT